jgi:hypothetical protein
MNCRVCERPITDIPAGKPSDIVFCGACLELLGKIYTQKLLGEFPGVYVTTGIITDVYEDLGPCCRVTVQLDEGGTMTFDASDIPFDYKELKASIGKRLTVRTEARIEDQ